MPAIFSSIASVLDLIGYAWYGRDLFRGTTKPNLSSWIVWVGISLLSASSYALGTGDIVKFAPSLAILAANIAIIVLILKRAKFSRPANLDIAAIVIGVVAGAAWLITRSALFGNALIQIAIVAGGIPTYRSVWLSPRNEKPWPWLLWSIASIFVAVVVLLRWTGQPLELLYPVVSILLYGGIGLLAFRNKDRQAVLYKI